MTAPQSIQPDSTVAQPAAAVTPTLPQMVDATLPQSNGAPTLAWTGPAPAGAAPLVPGYEILGELGRGGMGIVYKARQTALQRLVALKMVLAGERASPEFLARFRAEAEAAARLQHPNIVQLYEFGEAAGQPYFTLEFVDGGSLADRLRGAAQPVEFAAELIATLAAAMHYAHTHGVVHRDLKPANILMAAIPKIADFGLAKLLDATSAQTSTGAVLGTPSYMSPEQASGHTSTVGPSADIYALGAILYECLVGRPPFRGATALETVIQVAADQPVAPRQLRPEVPRDLETICLRCLAKEPAKRYATAQALADDLHRFLAREPIAARPASTWERARISTRRHPARAVLYASIFCAAALLAVLGVRHNVVLSGAFEQVQAEHRQARRELIRRTVANGAKLADDGDYLGSLPWFVEALRLEDNPERESVHRMRIAGTLQMCPMLRQVCAHDAPVIDAVVRPDGHAVSTLRDDGSVRAWELAATANPARLLNPPQPGGRNRIASGKRCSLSYDSTGRWLCANLADRALCIDTAADPPTASSLGSGQARAIWVRHDRLLLCDSNRLSLRQPGAGQPVSSPVAFDGSPIISAAADSDGTHFSTGHQNGEVRVWAVEPLKSSPPVATLPGPVIRLQFSPDGRRLLAAGGAVAQIWDIAQNRLAARPMHHAQTITDAVYSPDGSTIATASIDDTARLWNAADGESYGDPLKHNSDVFRVAFSPDSRLLATCGDDNTARVWNVRTGLPHAPPLWHSGSTSAVAFADAQTLVTASEDGTVKLWRLEPPRDSPPPELPRSSLPRRLKIGNDGRYELVSVDEKLFEGAEDEYRVFDSLEKHWIRPGIVHPGGLVAIDVSPIGAMVATAGNDRTARLWDWTTGREVVPALGHGSRVSQVVFGPNGRHVATSSDDNSARVWDVASGQPVTPPLWHNGTIRRIQFSPDGRLLLTAGKGDMAYLWDIATGEEIAPVRLSDPWVTNAFASRRAAGLWNLPVETRPIDDLVLLAQWLSGHRIDTTGGLAPLTAEDFRAIGDAFAPRQQSSLAGMKLIRSRRAG